MKLQCPCGAKYAFDITPEMLHQPVAFVCPACGQDSSAFVRELIQREFGGPASAEVAPAPAAPVAPAGAPRLKIHHDAPPTAAAAGEAPVSKFCQRHPGVPVEAKCTICQKPICHECLVSFGYFCSPLCKNKADLQGIHAPRYAQQKYEVEQQFWRKTGLIAGSIAGGIALLIGVWIWYAWFGSVPHNYLSVRFPDDDRAYAGKSVVVGQDQAVFLHGGTLARYDLRSKKPVWTQELITKEAFDAALKEAEDEDAQSNSGGGYSHHRNSGEIARDVKVSLQNELLLRVSGQNIWVGKGDKLTHYDWNTGKVLKEITLPENGYDLIDTGDELQMLGETSVTHISLATGESHVEQFGDPGAQPVVVAKAGNTGGGLLSTDGKPLDPSKVNAQAKNLTIPGRIALPALVANAAHETQLENALKDDAQHPAGKQKWQPLNFELVPGETGFVQFSRKLLEEKIVTRVAMKAAPKKSALDGEVNASRTMDVANELLNEMQRNAGGDTVEEDESRYQVTVHLPDSSSTADWTGEVSGPPQLFPLKTVNVIAAGKSLIVLDKTNKKVWEATLTYPVSGGDRWGFLTHASSQFGDGPCVEHGDTLYVFDQAILSAFDLSTGNARWRIPSVGVVGLFFDDQGFLYVNTTSGKPDDIKYSRQIDVTKETDNILLKLDPKDGKTIWTTKPGGFISYLHGKYIYTIQSYDPNPTDEEVNDLMIQKPAYLRIARINPKNGKVMWEYYDSRDRCPIDTEFKDNMITLVYKREVQVLKYLSF